MSRGGRDLLWNSEPTETSNLDGIWKLNEINNHLLNKNWPTTAITVPGQVTNVRFDGWQYSFSPNVYFDPPNDDGGSPITGYRIAVNTGCSVVRCRNPIEYYSSYNLAVGDSLFTARRFEPFAGRTSCDGYLEVTIYAINEIGESTGLIYGESFDFCD